jgi:choline dehydrogenase
MKARREIIISCGAIRSPQLLQLSGIGPAKLLDSLGISLVLNLAGVGENLRDHYSVRLTQRVSGTGTLNERVALHWSLSFLTTWQGDVAC